ncbi:MAG: hypothetical protein JJ957_19925 [Pseudomonadales bacterium]|nr:hypothetical protein [Pseudomonadales bacterium]MBO6824517.1 hypothetical protein [Pseudomonadales bacterium]
MNSVARVVSLFKRHQMSSMAALNSVFGEGGYLADEAEMGLIRLLPTHETGETTPRTNRRPKTKTEKRAKPKSKKTNNKGAQKGKTRKRKGS